MRAPRFPSQKGIGGQFVSVHAANPFFANVNFFRGGTNVIEEH
jgi:hypothetical protein